MSPDTPSPGALRRHALWKAYSLLLALHEENDVPPAGTGSTPELSTDASPELKGADHGT